jgi:hypothetical protein
MALGSLKAVKLRKLSSQVRPKCLLNIKPLATATLLSFIILDLPHITFSN